MTKTAELQHVGYEADREPTDNEIIDNEGKIWTWADKEPEWEVAEKFDSKEGLIEAELYRKGDKGVIKFYRENDSEPYNVEEFESYEKADNEFFSLDHQVINKFYL